jgi:hypothetical protein
MFQCFSDYCIGIILILIYLKKKLKHALRCIFGIQYVSNGRRSTE